MLSFNFEQVEYNNAFPFNAFVVSIDNSSYHMHAEYEILILLKGSLLLFLNSKPVELQEGDVFLINPKTIHSIRHTESENICMVLQLNPSLFQEEDEGGAMFQFDLNTSRKDVVTRLDVEDFTRTAALLTKLIRKRDKKDIYRIRAYVYKLIADLIEHVPYDIKYHSRTSVENTGIVMMIVEYLEKNIHDYDVLDNLCSDLGLSSKSVYRILKDNIDLSAKELIDNIRIDNAKRLLKFTQKSIEYIVDYCGFGSEGSFYRVFKKKTGLTPTEYRKNDFSMEKLTQIQGYINYRNREAQSLLEEIIEEE